MKIFILQQVEKCSNNYHEGGGVVVIAEDIEHAKKVLSEDKNISITDSEWRESVMFKLAKKTEPCFWVMPDAGCC